MNPIIQTVPNAHFPGVDTSKIITLRFLNLETREKRSIETKLVSYWCEYEGAMCYQLQLLDGTPAAEDAMQPSEAISNGAWSTIPERQWGWTDVCRWGAA